MNKLFRFFPFIFIFYTISGCETKTAKPYEFSVPANFPPASFPKNTPLNHEIIELGKMLFYDPALSGNDSISCASCHNIDYAFSDYGNSLSKGVHGTTGFRNSPGLFNLIWEKSLFRDGGVSDLETQVITPVTAHFEMDQNFKTILIKLNKKPEYKTAFEKAFGSDSITGQKILSAIAQFERTILSTDSRYDRWLRKEPGASLNETELHGLHLFEEKCASCHQGILFKDDLFHNNGIDSIFPGFEKFDEPKLGRARITYKAEDRGKYKTPTLRNIELTAPYMHDGRLKSLEDVLNHYQGGVKFSSTLDPILYKGNKTGILLSNTEKQEIISFLKTLTDTVFIKNPKYRNPLKTKNTY